MKPLKLVFSAFGPYAKESTIDFEALGGKGLFLITGPTGAGKTTIFDALAYALYGKASGDFRSDAMLRSHYADPKTPTFVELLFEHNGRLYRVKRNPSYERPKLRGDGTTTEVACAELYENEKVLATKIGEVTEKIESLLGITYDQFTQIAMIAQGDFRKVLTSDTEARGKILRKVFGTEIFKTIEEELGKVKSNAEKAYEMEVRGVAEALKRAEYPETFESKEEYEKLKKTAFTENTERGSILLEKMIAIDNSEIVTKETEKKQVRVQADHLKLLVDRCERDAHDRKEIEKLISQINALIPEVEKAEKRKEEAEYNDEKATELSLEIKKIQDMNEIWKLVQEKEREISELRIKESSVFTKLENEKKMADARGAELKQTEEELENLKDVETNYEKYVHLLEIWKQKYKDFQKICSNRKINAESLSVCQDNKQSVKDIQNKTKDALNQKDLLIKEMEENLALLKNISGHLADAGSAFETQKALVEKYTSLTRQIEMMERERKKQDETVAELKTRTEKICALLEKKYQRLEKLKDSDIKKIKNESEIQKAEERKKDLEKICGEESAAVRLKDDLETLKKRFVTEEENRKIREENCLKLKSLYYSSMAGILAMDLEEGKSCPVCGSCSHPKPAKMLEKAPTKEMLEEEKTCMGQLREEASALKGKIESSENERRSLVDDKGFGNETPEIVIEKLKEDERQLEEKKKKAERDAKRKEKLEIEIKKLREDVLKLREKEKRQDGKFIALKEKESNLLKEKDIIEVDLSEKISEVSEDNPSVSEAEEILKEREKDLKRKIDCVSEDIKRKNSLQKKFRDTESQIVKDRENIMQFSKEAAGLKEKRKAEEKFLAGEKAKVKETRPEELEKLGKEKKCMRESLLLEKSDSEKDFEDKSRKMQGLITEKDTLNRGLLKEKIDYRNSVFVNSLRMQRNESSQCIQKCVHRDS